MNKHMAVVFAVALTVIGTGAAYAGPITIYTTPAAGATPLPIPNWASIELSYPRAAIIPFSGNSLTVANNALVIFDAGTTIPNNNTVPSLMIANTLVISGEDDFLLEFESPIDALGMRLLTNYAAHEIVTFRDSAGVVVESVSLDALTAPNARQFIGFSSSVPFSSVFIDTEGGAFQNEGIDLLEVGGTWPASVPDPGSTLILLGLGLAGLRAWRRLT